ncbi:MAG: hypothetical protein DCC43_04755, partial [Candidatus Brocadia sp.]
GEMVSVGVDRLTEEVKGVSTLHPAGLPNGKQPRPKNLSLVAAGTLVCRHINNETYKCCFAARYS